MSSLEEHDAEQAAITALCESGQCKHPECRGASAMIIYVLVWESDDGTEIFHFVSDDRRERFLFDRLEPHWDENENGPTPDHSSDLWDKITLWAPFWFVTADIDLNGADSDGTIYLPESAA